MREILFRGKSNWAYGNVKEGDWLYSMTIRRHCYNDEEITSYYIGDGNKTIDAKTLGQYIGLTDKNGTKIFEGDIVRYGLIYDYNCYLESLEHPEEYDNEVYDQDIEVSAVEWCSKYDYPAFDLANHEFECNGLSQIMCGDYEYEVIGNIHDNPELLNGGDNE